MPILERDFVAGTFIIWLSKVCLLDIDVQGVKAVKASFLRAKYVFISPPSYGGDRASPPEISKIRQTQFCLSILAEQKEY